jgi:hypothetical protein
LCQRKRFSQEELKVVLKKIGLTKIYKFNQKELEFVFVPKGKGLAKKS